MKRVDLSRTLAVALLAGAFLLPARSLGAPPAGRTTAPQVPLAPAAKPLADLTRLWQRLTAALTKTGPGRDPDGDPLSNTSLPLQAPAAAPAGQGAGMPPLAQPSAGT